MKEFIESLFKSIGKDALYIEMCIEHSFACIWGANEMLVHPYTKLPSFVLDGIKEKLKEEALQLFADSKTFNKAYFKTYIMDRAQTYFEYESRLIFQIN